MRTEIRLVITGMGCRRCVREVTARLRDVPGVETVAADAATCRVRLSGTMAAADVMTALSGTTYDVTLLDPAPPSDPRTARGQRQDSRPGDAAPTADDG